MKVVLKILIAIVVLASIGLLTFFWMIKQAFGPVHSTKQITLDNGVDLRCEEEYNADFADVFYNVDFYVDQQENSVYLGKAFFNDVNWENEIETFFAGGWTFFICHNEDEHIVDELLGYNASENKALRDIPPFQIKSAKPLSMSLDSLKNDQLYIEYSYFITSDSIFKSKNVSLMFLPFQSEFRLIKEDFDQL